MNHFVVGGGIAGLCSSFLLTEKYPNDTIYLVEKSSELGGLLRSFHYGEHGTFDYGIHNILETGLEVLDTFLYNLLPENKWNVLEKDKRDLGGTYFNGFLQTDTPYIDLRRLENSIRKECIGDFFDNLNRKDLIPTEEFIQTSNAYDVLAHRFGESITDKVTRSPLKKLYGKELEELSSLATMITPFERVVFFDEPIIKDFTSSEILRQKLAFVDQRHLPLEKSSGKKCFYPKDFGMYRAIEAFRAQLEKRNVRICLNSELSEIYYDENNIYSLRLNKEKLEHIGEVIWSAGPFAATSALKLSFPKHPYDPPKKTAVFHALFNKPIQMADLYYLYVYDAPFKSFRVINYENYCPNAVVDNKHPVTVELLLDANETDEDALILSTLNELEQMGIIDQSYETHFKKIEFLPNGFPTPSLNNIHFIDCLRDQIKKKNLQNFTLVGIHAEKHLFFQDRILRDLYSKIIEDH